MRKILSILAGAGIASVMLVSPGAVSALRVYGNTYMGVTYWGETWVPLASYGAYAETENDSPSTYLSVALCPLVSGTYQCQATQFNTGYWVGAVYWPSTDRSYGYHQATILGSQRPVLESFDNN